MQGTKFYWLKIQKVLELKINTDRQTMIFLTVGQLENIISSL